MGSHEYMVDGDVEAGDDQVHVDVRSSGVAGGGALVGGDGICGVGGE